MAIYAYARVSSASQNLDRQIEAFKKEGIPEENIFTDKVSGKDFNRPGYQALLSILQQGDKIYIKSIDRLGRSYDDIHKEWNYIVKDLLVDICVLDMPLLNTECHRDLFGTFSTDLMFSILSFQAEAERISIKERQAEGIRVAHEKGVKFGRPRLELPENFEELYQRLLSGESMYSVTKNCPTMSPSTLRTRLLERLEQDKNN